MITDRYKQAFGQRVTQLAVKAIPHFKAKYPDLKHRGFRPCADVFLPFWDRELPEVPLSKNGMQAWFDGRSVAKGKRLDKLASMLNTTIEYLLDGEGSESAQGEARQDIPEFDSREVDDPMLQRIGRIRNVANDLTVGIDELAALVRMRMKQEHQE